MLRLSASYNLYVATVNMIANKCSRLGQWSRSACCSCPHDVVCWLARMRQPKPYHHGHLEAALLKTAIQLIGEVGPAGFTFREVARRAGVSHNAPYRHFAGKDDLLLAVAAEGFERLRVAMMKHMECGTSAGERLVLCGCGYVDFALHWPQHFLVMFDLAGSLNGEAKQKDIGQSAFQVLLDAITEAQKAGVIARGDPIRMAWTAWSLVHGIAKLATGGNLPLNKRMTIEFTRQASESMIRGMEHSR